MSNSEIDVFKALDKTPKQQGFHFTVRNNLLHSDITGTLTDPAIIITIDKTNKDEHKDVTFQKIGEYADKHNEKDVTFQKIGEYAYLKSDVLPQYEPLMAIQDVILLSIDTMPIDKIQQCILLNHVTNTSLSSLTKTFIAQLFSNDVMGCKDTINKMLDCQ